MFPPDGDKHWVPSTLPKRAKRKRKLQDGWLSLHS